MAYSPRLLADGNWVMKQNQPVSKIETKYMLHTCLVPFRSPCQVNLESGQYLDPVNDLMLLDVMKNEASLRDALVCSGQRASWVGKDVVF